MYYPNMYGALPQMQDRLMRMEQGYTAMPTSLPGHIVSSIEEARAQQIIPNGNSYFFPSPSEKRIYEKSTDLNGQPIFRVYELTEIPAEIPVTAASIAGIESRLVELEKALLEIRGGRGNESNGDAGHAPAVTESNRNVARNGRK